MVLLVCEHLRGFVAGVIYRDEGHEKIFEDGGVAIVPTSER